MNNAVERAAKFIWEHYSEPLSLADIAESARLSRFHLCRKFQAATSVPPCRFLSAVRIYQAKHLLLATPVSVTDVSFAVGYSSVGSFTNYFTSSVGVPPSLFRRMARDGGFELPCPRLDPPPGHGAVHGTISLPGGCRGARAYVGAFTTAVVQDQPAVVVVVDIPADGRSFPYRLPNVPAGTFFIHAVGVAGRAAPGARGRGTALVGGPSPVSVTPGACARAAISLRPRRMTDPPVLLALPDLEGRPAGSVPSEAELSPLEA